MKYIIGENTIEAWKKALKVVLRGEIEKGRKRIIKKEENMIIRINNAYDYKKSLEILHNTTPWEYPSLETIKELLFNPTHEKILPYSYGYRILNLSGLNQLRDYIIPLLKKKRNSRSAIITLIDPLIDLKETKILPSMIFLQFRIINEELWIKHIIRSNDLLIGWPFNIIVSRLLQEKVSRELDVKIGGIDSITLETHIYREYEPLIEKILRG